MQGFVGDISSLTAKAWNFREGVYRQSIVNSLSMSLTTCGEIGIKVHDLDQFFRVEQGSGVAMNNDVRTLIERNMPSSFSPGRNNIVNTGEMSPKLYSVGSPPAHQGGVVPEPLDDAAKDDEHFDGVATERFIPVTVSDRKVSVPISLRPRLSVRFPSSTPLRT